MFMAQKLPQPAPSSLSCRHVPGGPCGAVASPAGAVDRHAACRASPHELADAAARTPGRAGGPRRRSAASAQMWVTGSSGSGRASTHPPSWMHLHPVDQLQLAVLALLDEAAHHQALLLPRRDDRLVGHVHPREPVRRPPTACVSCRRQQLEQLDQGGRGVEGGQEAREDVAAVVAGRRSRRPARLAASMSAARGRLRVAHLRRRARRARSSTTRLTLTGSGDLVAEQVPGHERHEAPAAPRRR